MSRDNNLIGVWNIQDQQEIKASRVLSRDEWLLCQLLSVSQKRWMYVLVKRLDIVLGLKIVHLQELF